MVCIVFYKYNLYNLLTRLVIKVVLFVQFKVSRYILVEAN